MRRLTPAEAALWSRVTDSMRAYGPRPPRPAPMPAPPTQPVIAAPAPAAPSSRRPPPVRAAGLDGHWDRRLRGGRLVPELTIDLHGCSREQAEAQLTRRLGAAAGAGVRVVLVITGKGGQPGPSAADLMAPGRAPRGAIRASLPRWLEHPELRPLILALRPAHPRHGGGGAWYVILARARA